MHAEVQVHMLSHYFSIFTGNIKGKCTVECMKDPVFGIHLPICLRNYVLFLKRSAHTLQRDWLSSVYPLAEAPSRIAFALRVAQAVSSVRWSTQRDQSRDGLCRLQHFWCRWLVAPAPALPGHPPRASTRWEILSLFPTRWQCDSKRLLLLAGGRQTALPLLQVVSTWKFTLLHIISKSFPFHGRWIYLEALSCFLLSSPSFFFFLLFTLLIFFLHYVLLFTARMFINLFYIKAGLYSLLCTVIIRSKV